MYLKITSRRIKFPKALDFNVYALELLMKDRNLVISIIGRELRTLIICLGTKYFVHIRGVSDVHNTYASEMINSV